MSAFTRMLRRKGETWTINAWTGATRDEYEDELPTGEDTDTFKAIRVSAVTETAKERTELGVTRWAELDLLVSVDLELPEGADPERPVTLTAPEGRIYSLIGIDHAGSPVGAKRMKLRSGGGDASVYL